MLQTHDSPYICMVIDVLAVSWARTVAKMSVEGVVINAVATVLVEALTDGAVGAGVDALLDEEIIAVMPAVVASDFIVSARLAIGIGDCSDAWLAAIVEMLIDALVETSDGLVTDMLSSIGVGILASANVNESGAAMTAWECPLLPSLSE